MARCVGDLEPLLLERLRAELAEVLAARFAYPPFFDYQHGRAITRPADRRKRQEIASYLATLTFDAVARADVGAPDVRRLLERVLERFLAVNAALGGRYAQRTQPQQRSWIPAIAAEVQRGFVAAAQGGAAGFGAPRAARERDVDSTAAPYATPNQVARDTGVLQMVLSRSRPTGAYRAAAAGAAPRGVGGAGSGALAPAGFGDGNGHAPAHEVPQEILSIYGEYLDDARAGTQATDILPAMGSIAGDAPGTLGTRVEMDVGAPDPQPPGAAQPDALIFAQLRYQVAEYIRRASRAYGLAERGGDPARMLDALRRSRLVDEADLQIAERLLALTDRLAAGAPATVEEYRQALMLYLLYHRVQPGG